MKALLLTLALSAQFLTAHGQAPQAKPKAKDSLVLIQTTDSAVVALKKVATIFVTQGYTVEKLDTQFLTLTLAPKTLTIKNNPMLSVRASASKGANSILTLTGEYKAMLGEVALNGLAKFEGVEWGLNSKCFRAIESIALTYPSGQVLYGKQ